MPKAALLEPRVAGCSAADEPALEKLAEAIAAHAGAGSGTSAAAATTAITAATTLAKPAHLGKWSKPTCWLRASAHGASPAQPVGAV